MPHETLTLRTCDLIGAALDWAVAKACNAFVAFDFDGRLMDMSDLAQFGARPTYSPSTDWSQVGPLIGMYLIEFSVDDHTDIVRASMFCWRDYGKSHRTRWSEGETHLIAACRAIVSAHLGDSVDVPAELVGGGHE